MLSKRNIFLIGPMGSGKSAVGRHLARLLRLSFHDSDADIEAKTGVDVAFIFEKEGEEGFRVRERESIDRLTRLEGVVIATGGGAVMRQETRDRIRDKAVSIWLKVDTDVIMRRVKRRSDRPLLQTADPEATVERLVREREPVYSQADVTVWSRDIPHDKIVDECLEALYEKLCAGRATQDGDSLGATS